MKRRSRTGEDRDKRSTEVRSPNQSVGTRLLRAIPVLIVLVILIWLFGHSGVVHKLETLAIDTGMRLNAPLKDSPIVIVEIDDQDYRDLFESTSPLCPKQLQKLLTDIVRGNPTVIGIDIDTSSSKFARDFKLENWGPEMVWERDLRKVPEEISEFENMQPLDILGGRRDVDPGKNSSGLPLLIEDTADKVTRCYRRSIATTAGTLPTFPFSIAKDYLQNKPEQLAKLPESAGDLLIRYSGDRKGSNRLHLSARKVTELSEHWPESSPLTGKIVLLGGSYLGEDKHDTPIGQLTGLEIMANVVETELSGGGEKPPSKKILFFLEIFEALVLTFFFDVLRLRTALACSVLLIPIMAIVCSELAYRDINHFALFASILVGLLIFELYGHFRGTAVPKIYHEIRGSSRS